MIKFKVVGVLWHIHNFGCCRCAAVPLCTDTNVMQSGFGEEMFRELLIAW